ncbi:MAG TPA: sigma-70 family RNA polymerase sigma factor [Pseudonocardiaceae bacterium]|nr:sigma-70 family RNA polymerase sigma factor [Pseudonocardiaceae bacterium]
MDDRETLYQALATLSERDASIVLMRFFGNITQTQITREIGMSQMQVSRVLARSLACLRSAFTDASPTSAGD